METFENSDHADLILSMISEDGDQGYPGKLNVSVTYSFNDDNELIIKYRATTDKATIINLSQHSYFNLNGHSSGSIIDHEISINAAHYTPVNENLIPTGEIVTVDNTPLDFRKVKPIARDINSNHKQIILGSGFDHNWVLDSEKAAIAYSPKTGRVLEVITDKPGIQFYSGNFLDGKTSAKEGALYKPRSGFCLETQYFPDSPNHSNFPPAILRPEEEYQSTTIFKFKVRH